MAVSTDSIPYREGGYNTTVHQIPGQTAFAPLTMQRGVLLGTDENWKWMKQLFQTVQGTVTRTAASDFRVDIDIDVLSHPLASTATAGNSAGTYNDNAWITSLAYSDLNAGDNAILVEQMSLTHEGFEVIWGKDLTDAGSAAVRESEYEAY
jgi:phage tail-like protein